MSDELPTVRDKPMPIDHWFKDVSGISLNYMPNDIDWRPGDLVLHDFDAKRGDMLMRVVGYVGGLVQTEYVDPDRLGRWGAGKKSRLVNRLSVLHNPARFGVSDTANDKKE